MFIFKLQTGFLEVNSSNGDRHGITLTWKDLSVYVTEKKKKGYQAPFKRILNNGILNPECYFILFFFNKYK